MDLLINIWNFKLQIFPILLAVVLFELPAIIRRKKKLYYVPIYFSVFPLRELNQDLSTYLVDGEYADCGEPLSTKEAEKLKKKIMLVSMVSMLVGALLTPLYVGFASAFFMDKELFIQFVSILLIYKTVLLFKSIYEFHYHLIASAKNRMFLGIIYFVYLGVVFEVLRNSFTWTLPFVKSGDWLDLLSSLSTLLFGKVVIGIFLLVLLTSYFSSLVTDRDIRKRALSRDE